MKYTLTNLDCANCASKIETKIKKIKGVHEVSVNFMTCRLTIEADNLDDVMIQARAIINKIDKNIVVR